MSLMKTLAKVAIGVAVAKGVSSVIKGQGQGQAKAGTRGGGGLFDGLGGSGRTTRETGLEGMMDEILGGRRGGGAARTGGGAATGGSAGGSAGGATGGLGGLLEQLAGGRSGGAGRSSGRGGLDDLIGQLGGAGGGLGGILGGLAGALAGKAGTGSGGSFGEVLNSQFDANPEPARQPSAAQEVAAGLMLRAMIQAAKSDGKIDRAEEERLLDKLGEVGPEERAFVEAEMRAPVDPEALGRQVPEGLGPQVYAMSVLAIDLDSRAEAEHLHRLATAVGLGKDEVNAIHDQLGVPPLYR